jgi:cytochrome oxidase assembly protein ShyY1
MSPESEIQLPTEETPSIEKAGSTALRVITWFSVGMAVAVVGIYVGAELRSRSKFKKRTPYDFYSNAGEYQASEFGVGI